LQQTWHTARNQKWGHKGTIFDFSPSAVEDLEPCSAGAAAKPHALVRSAHPFVSAR